MCYSFLCFDSYVRPIFTNFRSGPWSGSVVRVRGGPVRGPSVIRSVIRSAVRSWFCRRRNSNNSMGWPWTVYIGNVGGWSGHLPKRIKTGQKNQIVQIKKKCAQLNPPKSILAKKNWPVSLKNVMVQPRVSSNPKVVHSCHIFRFVKQVVCKAKLQAITAYRKFCVTTTNYNL